jgi:serine/threonine protein kinase
LDKKVAVKVLHQSVEPRVFQRELDVWKQLSHPNILQFFGGSSLSSEQFYVCAFKPNGDATRYLQLHPNADRCRLVSEVDDSYHEEHSLSSTVVL